MWLFFLLFGGEGLSGNYIHDDKAEELETMKCVDIHGTMHGANLAFKGVFVVQFR